MAPQVNYCNLNIAAPSIKTLQPLPWLDLHPAPAPPPPPHPPDSGSLCASLIAPEPGTCQPGTGAMSCCLWCQVVQTSQATGPPPSSPHISCLYSSSLCHPVCRCGLGSSPVWSCNRNSAFTGVWACCAHQQKNLNFMKRQYTTHVLTQERLGSPGPGEVLWSLQGPGPDRNLDLEQGRR